jgi:hypothetical protein
MMTVRHVVWSRWARAGPGHETKVHLAGAIAAPRVKEMR